MFQSLSNFTLKKYLEETTKAELNKNATDFHIAAVNYHERNYDLQQSKTWMEKAIFVREKPNYWDYREFSVILSKLGKYKEAIRRQSIVLNYLKWLVIKESML